MLLQELEELEDITDTLVFEEEPTIFNEENTLQLMETTFQLLDEYMYDNPTILSEPNFYEIILDDLKEMLYMQFENHILDSDFIEDDLNDLLEDVLNIFISTFHPERSISINQTGTNMDEETKEIIETKIQRLREIPQPTQRTPEWYDFRWNLITASNAYKAFESQSSINQLIFEKCQPIKLFNEDGSSIEQENKMVNITSPMHWGQKYEPVTVLVYENEYKTKVEDFGCIQHSKYHFLGASPDGINIDNTSDRYGRMLEIKNVVSREITGIPKKEYWIQMQLQMEVCDLDECDFVETKFIEYPDMKTFDSDILNNNDNDNVCLSKDNKNKGIIIYFHTKEGKPFYLYKPLEIICKEEIHLWCDTGIDLYQSEQYSYTFMKFIYWKLEKISCVLVARNKEWFTNNISQIGNIWKIIEEERKTGYQHRAPVKKNKKEPLSVDITQTKGCLLKFNNIIKIDS